MSAMTASPKDMSIDPVFIHKGVGVIDTYDTPFKKILQHLYKKISLKQPSSMSPLHRYSDKLKIPLPLTPYTQRK